MFFWTRVLYNCACEPATPCSTSPPLSLSLPRFLFPSLPLPLSPSFPLPPPSPSSLSFSSYRQGRCKLSAIGQACEVGLRRRHYYILSGSVLGVWTHLEAVLARHSGHNNRMQIARVQSNRSRLVGECVYTYLYD